MSQDDIIYAARSVIMASIAVTITAITKFYMESRCGFKKTETDYSLMEEDVFDGFDEQLEKRWGSIKKLHDGNIIYGLSNKEAYSKLVSKVSDGVSRLSENKYDHAEVIDNYILDIWASEHNINVALTAGSTRAVANACRESLKRGTMEVQKIFNDEKINAISSETLAMKLRRIILACEKVFNTESIDMPLDWLSEDNICELNKLILLEERPKRVDNNNVNLGAFRTVTTSGGIGQNYLSADDITDALEMLLSFIKAAWPKTETVVERILLAAFFIERFLFIHPFSNGNGRTARLLFSVLLKNDILVPVCFFNTENNRSSMISIRKQYIELLAGSRSVPVSEVQYFCGFILKRTNVFIQRMSVLKARRSKPKI